MEENTKEKYLCPGHEEKCEFCKSEEGKPRFVNGMLEVDRMRGEAVVDPCCKACAANMKHNARKYYKTSIS